MTPSAVGPPLHTVGVCIACTFALGHACLPNGSLDIDFASMFANGLAVALYAPLIRANGPRPRRLVSCICLGVLGAFHFAWLAASLVVLDFGLRTFGLSPSARLSNALMFVVTGIPFAAVIIADLRSTATAAVVLGGVIASTLTMTFEFLWRHPIAPPHAIGFPAGFLHLGIGLSLFYAATKERRAHTPGLCPVCAYDLTGLAPGAPCPECGGVQIPAVPGRA